MSEPFSDSCRYLLQIAQRRSEPRRESHSSPHGPGSNGWENGTIEAFLDAAVAWKSASQSGLEFYDPPDNPWRRCADIFYAGKSYE
ncbi:MAG TPA: hypothetical protein VGR26_16065 [Acidimicrobiales bacterium]|nr:hypothetical protein [Acidimicrobiales bacterium]